MCYSLSLQCNLIFQLVIWIIWYSLSVLYLLNRNCIREEKETLVCYFQSFCCLSWNVYDIENVSFFLNNEFRYDNRVNYVAMRNRHIHLLNWNVGHCMSPPNLTLGLLFSICLKWFANYVSSAFRWVELRCGLLGVRGFWMFTHKQSRQPHFSFHSRFPSWPCHDHYLCFYLHLFTYRLSFTTWAQHKWWTRQLRKRTARLEY